MILDRIPPPVDERVRYGDGGLRFADVRSPGGAGPWPCVIAIHGGFWRNRYSLDHLGHLCAALTGLGLVTVNTEYRRVGDPGGGWPGSFHDVSSAASWVFNHASELQIDPGRVIVVGHSAGGHLASWLVSMANVPAGSIVRSDPLPFWRAVSLAGVLDLHEGWSLNLSDGAVAGLLGGEPADVPERYAETSPILLTPSPVPHLLVHGEGDDTVPVAMSEAYHDSAARQGGMSSLLRLPGADHYDVIDPESPVWPTIASAILDAVIT